MKRRLWQVVDGLNSLYSSELNQAFYCCILLNKKVKYRIHAMENVRK